MLIIFDLDGTIVESGQGIINSFKYSFEKMGLETPTMEELKTYIGPPLLDTFNTKFNFKPEDSQKALEFYREHYKAKGKFECNLYPGIIETIKDLSENHKIALGTSKVQESAKEILEYYDIAKYFSFIGGASRNGSRNNKTKVLEYVLENVGDYDLNKAYMIGDRFYDIEGAKNCGLKSIGVTWGYGERKELLEAGAGYIVDNSQELKKLINSLEQV